ncbi:hypothetical protein V8C86DRAFT_3135188 [Haematococcus lacustris]
MTATAAAAAVPVSSACQHGPSIDGASLPNSQHSRNSSRRICSSSNNSSEHVGGPAVQQQASSAGALSGLPLARLYLACHARNLIRNPTFAKSLNWVLNPLDRARKPWAIRNTGDSVRFENPPQDVTAGDTAAPPCLPPPPLPYPRCHSGLLKHVTRLLAPEMPGCLATSKEWAELVQVVDLAGELCLRGLSAAQAAAVLDSGLPLGLSLQVATHSCHAAHLAVGLMLDAGAPGQPVPSMQAWVEGRQGGHRFYSGRLHLQPTPGWRRFAYLLPACPAGCRRAVVLVRGREAAGVMEGPCGVKLASAQLSLLNTAGVASWGENAASSEWQQRPDGGEADRA